MDFAGILEMLTGMLEGVDVMALINTVLGLIGELAGGLLQ
jgi:hypothetical protein